MRGAFAISIVRFNTKRKNVVWAPAFGGPIGFSLVSLMDNTALLTGTETLVIRTPTFF